MGMLVYKAKAYPKLITGNLIIIIMYSACLSKNSATFKFTFWSGALALGNETYKIL